jgi:hypothetical protein
MQMLLLLSVLRSSKRTDLPNSACGGDTLNKIIFYLKALKIPLYLYTHKHPLMLTKTPTLTHAKHGDICESDDTAMSGVTFMSCHGHFEIWVSTNNS